MFLPLPFHALYRSPSERAWYFQQMDTQELFPTNGFVSGHVGVFHRRPMAYRFSGSRPSAMCMQMRVYAHFFFDRTSLALTGVPFAPDSSVHVNVFVCGV